MQLYRGMDIGTAKLPADERRGIPHHQLDVLDVTETATVARYQQAAAADIEAIAARGAVPIIVGGSMMYIQSLLDEWTFPATDPRCGPAGSSGSPRSGSRRSAPGAGARRRRRRGVDPAHRRPAHRAGAGGGRTDRPTVRGVGVPAIGAPRWDTAIIGLDWEHRFSTSGWPGGPTRCSPRVWSTRCTALLAAGLRDGVTASRALGYAQVIADLDDGGDGSAARASRRSIGTRRYVRRQRSWFRRDHRITWLDGGRDRHGRGHAAGMAARILST